MSRWLIFIFILSIWCCRPEQAQKHKTTNFFYDINGLIDGQVKTLDSINPSLFKKAIIDNKEEVMESIPSDSSWLKELMIFKSADINKPILVDSYITTEKSDMGNNTIIYKSKHPKTTEVDSLFISYKESRQNPLKIYARLSHENLLFVSEKILEISFVQVQDKSLISTYKIAGWQKMISRDSTSYFVEGLINYP